MTSAWDSIGPIRAGLHELGYTDDLLRSDVRVEGDRILDLLAYSSPDIQDMSTTAIAGQRLLDDGDRGVTHILDMARAVATPAALVGSDGRMRLFAVATRQQGDQLVDEFPATAAAESLRKYSRDLSPSALAKAKRAGRQLALFPLDVRLLASAREQSAEQLSVLVGEALAAAASAEQGDVGKGVTSVVTALALLVVRDRYQLPGTTAVSISKEALANQGDVFAWLQTLPLKSRGVITSLSTLLGTADFGWLDGAVISRLYEELLVTKEARRSLAIHYTPQELAQRMAAAIPFEALRPEDRTLLDPSCGSGTLLGAAHGRLVDLIPATVPGHEVHEIVKSSIRGWDLDPVAVASARLNLLVQSLPYGNHWAVERRNALDRASSSDGAKVISNPPWLVERGRRKDVAEAFLTRMRSLVEPGGFLACVLPAAWLFREKSSVSRRELLTDFDVFEVWRLPRDVFAQARHACCVIIGERKTSRDRRRHFVFRQVAPGVERIRNFFDRGDAAFAGIGTILDADSATLVTTPFEELQHFAKLPTLDGAATIVSGVVQRRPIALASEGIPILPRGAEVTALRSLPSSQVVRVARIEDFSVGWRDITALLSRKLLIQAARFPDNAWRARPVLDEIGVVPNNTWHAVIPSGGNDRETRRSLHALFGSSFASAWLYSTVATKWLPMSALKSFPLPFGGLEVVVENLAPLGRIMASGNDDQDTYKELDERVERLYRLPSSTRRTIRALLAGQIAPEGWIRYPHSPVAEIRHQRQREAEQPGAVLRIDGSNVWIWTPASPDDGVKVRLPARLPGWLCEEGATFQVIGEDLADAEYLFQRATYLSDAELLGSPGHV